jgi:hypothetical protein
MNFDYCWFMNGSPTPKTRMGEDSYMFYSCGGSLWGQVANGKIL